LRCALRHSIPQLQPYLKVICTMEINHDADSIPFRVLPDTCVELFVNCNGSSLAGINGKAGFNSKRSFITSRLTHFMDVQLSLGAQYISICF
jgi:hypothetical protein